MNIKILGSGGCVSLPRATCQCKVCNEAREKGEPYKRTACSLYIRDYNILIDTPEDINYQLNRDNIEKIEHILYSHWDPDHTMGMRIIEQLHEGWRYRKVENPIIINSLKTVGEDLFAIRNKFSSYLGYYESQNLCKFICGNRFNINSLGVELIEVKTNISSTVFIFNEQDKKLIYAPCDIKPFPVEEESLLDADLLIIGNSMPRGARFTEDNKALYYIDEIFDIGKKIRAKHIIITHIEEQWGLNYDDYKMLEKKFKDYITFAYDAMEIEL